MRSWWIALVLACATGCGVYAPAEWPDAEPEPGAAGEAREDPDGA